MDEIKYLCDILDFHLYHVRSIGSTNTFLKENYTKYPDRTIIWADVQTNGRGRYNRVWESNDDYIFSILFKENYSNEIIAPLAVVRALKSIGIDAKIKWPNDIYLNNKKLCGMLIESIYSSKHEATIVGIGINKNDKPEVNGIGINKDIDYKDLITKVINNYNDLINDNFDNYIDEYIDNNIVINKEIIYQNDDYIVTGITKKGHLLIKKDDFIKEISSDEINIKEAMKN
jgi:BirA family biotin operon repressor/biotin-[acetyl-CoA-carboxylase] ligase